jgi:hypothetical protein
VFELKEKMNAIPNLARQSGENYEAIPSDGNRKELKFKQLQILFLPRSTVMIKLQTSM